MKGTVIVRKIVAGTIVAAGLAIFGVASALLFEIPVPFISNNSPEHSLVSTAAIGALISIVGLFFFVD